MICFKFDIEWIKAQRNAELRVGSGINSVFLLLQFSKNLKHLRYRTLVIILSKWWLHHHCSFCFDIRRNIFLVIFFMTFLELYSNTVILQTWQIMLASQVLWLVGIQKSTLIEGSTRYRDQQRKQSRHSDRCSLLKF